MRDKPNWESMCRALWWCIELGAGDDIDELMQYIEKFIRDGDAKPDMTHEEADNISDGRGDFEPDHYEQVRYEEDKDS
tara:strand:- start:44 stop:277 length:234 start_codon:yes stop_codon:yes gene_type:complete